MKAKAHPLVLVEWVDSSVCREAWHDKEDDPKSYQPAKCRSVGWLLDRDKTRIVLHADTGDSQHGRFITIPTSCVKSIKTLVK